MEIKYGQKNQKIKIAVFEGQKIRRHWDEKSEKWYFSVTDVVATLSASTSQLAYWRKLKERLKNEGGDETVTKCHALKMSAADGKMRLTDVADTEVMLRLIQSIPSPNAEPFKLWLARHSLGDGGSKDRSIEKPYSWLTPVKDIVENDYILSANTYSPYSGEEEVNHRDPKEILKEIEGEEKKLGSALNEIKKSL